MEQGVMVETERLILRPHVAADVDPLEAVLGDAVAMESYPSAPDRCDVEERLARNLEQLPARWFRPIGPGD